MTDTADEGARSPQWLLDAGRDLGPSDADVERVTGSVVAAARRMSHPRKELVTDRTAVRVTDRVVRLVMMTRVRAELGRPVLQVVVESAAGEITRVGLGLACRYDDDLHGSARQARVAATAAATAALGAATAARLADVIDVRWLDVLTPAPAGADEPGN